MTSASLSPSKPATQRLPAPSLFVGPPSRNASSTSLSPTTTNTSFSRNPSNLQRAIHNRSPNNVDSPASNSIGRESSSSVRHNDASSFVRQRNLNEQRKVSTGARLTEMQNTLDEVEARAERGSHLFGATHSEALAALRNAQVALAQSWADNVYEDASSDTYDTSAIEVERPQAATADSVKNALEEETENDISLAKKRREANDRYFKKVSEGIQDVVSKLDDVAKTMKRVEQESKELWEDDDSIDSRSVLG